MAKIEKEVQGTYISKELKKILDYESDARNITSTRLASEILERGIKSFKKRGTNANQEKSDQN
ncbi:MAG: hypothetical protein WC143_04625 [Eubacteriales bacterium]|jgi:hypothetical protein